ncbi:FAD/NAD(P)-binding domain-containing protein [Xylariaceae sp. FL0255]|nr:FAD/NAD(P)-binding domain-containing protein [Xylariaceae sp. FL0255]
MAPSRPFRIVIAGGGIAGLTLANMCEKFGLDYILLEAHSEIWPAVGASIGLFANGLYILDQLGCYEAIQAVSHGIKYDTFNLLDGDGKPMSVIRYLQDHQRIRHGYGMVFFDRQMLLKVLYDNLKDKTPILLSKRVKKVIHSDNGVEVLTQDGGSFSGDILIGADGIHSTIRSEMRRIAELDSPKYFDKKEEDNVPCYYQCSFGIAQNVPNWSMSEQCFTCGNHTSFLVVSGPDNRVYWFLFVKLPTVVRGKAIPHYTKEDEAEFVSKYKDSKVREFLTFGELYACRLQSTLTAIHEVVYKKWFFGRVMLIGDSVHKTNPISGSGGNGAIETAASLLNALLDLRSDRPSHSLSHLSASEITKVFEKVQKDRHSDAKNFVKKAHMQQALQAFENPILSFLVYRVLVRFAGPRFLLRGDSLLYTRSTHLKYADAPKNLPPHVMPFTHELPAKPVESAIVKNGVWLGFGVAVAGLVYAMCKVMEVWNEDPSSKNWVRSIPVTPDEGSSWIGSMISRYGANLPYNSFSLLPDSSNSSTSTSSWNPSSTLDVQNIYTLAQMLSPILIFTIEGNRQGRSGGLLCLPLLYIIAMQLRSIFEVVPVWTLISFLTVDVHTLDRTVDADVARSLLPALLSSLAVAAFSTTSPGGWQTWIPISAILFPITTTAVAFFQKIQRRRAGKVQSERHEEWYSTEDVPYLKLVYDFALVIQAAFHLAVVAYIFLSASPPVSFQSLYANSTSIFSLSNGGWDWDMMLSRSGVDKDTAVMGFGLLVLVIAVTCQNLHAIWQLRKIGYITTWTGLKVAAAALLGQVVVGPGATWARLWRWREDVFVGLSGEFHPSE